MKDHYNILINKNAGTVERRGVEDIENIISESGIQTDSVQFLEPQDLFDTLKRLNGQKDKRILVGGGDGTIRSAAAILKEKSHSFGVLPLGTMNLLARDLKIPVDLKEAINAYAADCETLKIDLGIVNDKYVFLCCAALGTIPAASKVRERMRKNREPFIMPQLTAFVLSEIDRSNRKRLQLQMGGNVKSLKTAALVISNNQYTPQDKWDDSNFKRASLQDGQLGIYSAAPYSFWDKIRMMASLTLGNWKADPAITEWLSDKLEVRAANDTELVSLDGEPQDIEMPLSFSIQRHALSIIVPAQKGTLSA